MIPLVSSWEQCCFLFVLTLHSAWAYQTPSHKFILPRTTNLPRSDRDPIPGRCTSPLFTTSYFLSFLRPSSILPIDLLKPRALLSHFPPLICILCHITPCPHFVFVSFIVCDVDPPLFLNV